MKRYLIFVLLLLAGCSSVVMNEPFPDSRLTDQDMEALQGTWQIGTAVLYLHFKSDGTPSMATVKWNENAFTLVEHHVHIAKRDSLFYLSVQAQPDEDPQGHHFAAIKPRSNEMVAWSPDVAFFKGMVESDKLQGSVKEGEHATQVMLDTPAQDVLELITSNSDAISYQNPLILQRIE